MEKSYGGDGHHHREKSFVRSEEPDHLDPAAHDYLVFIDEEKKLIFLRV